MLDATNLPVDQKLKECDQTMEATTVLADKDSSSNMAQELESTTTSNECTTSLTLSDEAKKTAEAAEVTRKFNIIFIF